MSHKMTSPSPSSQQRELVTGLKPPLKSALGSLTVRLEDELIRYRRSQLGETPPSAQRILFKRDLKSLDLIAIKAKAPTPAAQGAPPPVPKNPRLSRAESISPTISSIPQARPTGPVADLPNFEPAAPTAKSLVYREPDDYLESSEALLESLATEAATQPQAVVPEPEASGSFWPSSLSTPVGMGGLLLLLVLSGGLGYALTNPAAVGQLLNHPIFNAVRPGDQDTNATDPFATEPSGVAGDRSDPSTLGPDLASKEFFDLNLHTLSQVSVPKPPVAVPTASTATTTTASTPTNTATKTTTTTAAATPQTPTTTPDRLAIAPTPPASRPAATAAPRPAAAPAVPRSSAPAPSRPAAAPPARTPSPAASAPAPTTSSSSGSTAAPGTHYVVTDYTGDQSLSEARGVVGDAYVRNFPNGARIQLGAFDDSSSANQMVQELQSQGVPAQVYTTP